MENRIYNYLKHNKGVGNTTITMDGARNADYKFLIVGLDMNHANKLAKETGNPFAIPVSMHDNKLEGRHIPMIIDNYTYIISCENYIRKITEQKKEISILKREVDKINDLNSIIYDINNISFLDRLFLKRYRTKLNSIINVKSKSFDDFINNLLRLAKTTDDKNKALALILYATSIKSYMHKSNWRRLIVNMTKLIRKYKS